MSLLDVKERPDHLRWPDCGFEVGGVRGLWVGVTLRPGLLGSFLATAGFDGVGARLGL